MRLLHRLTVCLVVMGFAAAYALAGTSTGQALPWHQQPRAQSAKLRTDYRIFKIYVNARVAGVRRAIASEARTDILVLRYGNRRWGLNHLKAKHDWGKALDNAIQYLVTDPNTKVRSEGGGSYRWDDTQVFKGERCDFRAVENRNRLSDGHEKGIISAYPLAPCGMVFLSGRR